MADIKIDSTWIDKLDGCHTVKVKAVDSGLVYGKSSLGKVYQEPIEVFLANFKPFQADHADMVNHPAHYKDASGIECIEVTRLMRFCGGNSFKYIYRAGNKGDLIQDLEKAIFYAREAEKIGEITSMAASQLIVKIAVRRSKFRGNAMESVKNSDWSSVVGWLEFEINETKMGEWRNGR